MGEDALEAVIEQLPEEVQVRLARAVLSALLLTTGAEGELKYLADVLTAAGLSLADEDDRETGLHMDGLSVTYCHVAWEPEYSIHVKAGWGVSGLTSTHPGHFTLWPPGFELVED